MAVVVADVWLMGQQLGESASWRMHAAGTREAVESSMRDRLLERFLALVCVGTEARAGLMDDRGAGCSCR